LPKLRDVVEKELVPLMEDFYCDELTFFTSDEFADRIFENGKTHVVTQKELDTKYNKDEFCPAGGSLIRAADHIAAFLEADQSIKYGITSVHLKDGRDNIRQSYKDASSIHGFNIAEFFARTEN